MDKLGRNNSLQDYLTNMQSHDTRSTDNAESKRSSNGIGDEEDVPTEHSTVTDDEEENVSGDGVANKIEGETRQEGNVVRVTRQTRSEYEAARRQRRQQQKQALASRHSSSEGSADVPPKPAEGNTSETIEKALSRLNGSGSKTVERKVKASSNAEAPDNDDESTCTADDRSVRSNRSTTSARSGTMRSPRSNRLGRDGNKGKDLLPRSFAKPSSSGMRRAQSNESDNSERKAIIRPVSAHKRLVPRGAKGLENSSHRRDTDRRDYGMMRSQHKEKDEEIETSAENSNRMGARSTVRDINEQYAQLKREQLNSPTSPSKKGMTAGEIKSAMLHVERQNRQLSASSTHSTGRRVYPENSEETTSAALLPHSYHGNVVRSGNHTDANHDDFLNGSSGSFTGPRAIEANTEKQRIGEEMRLTTSSAPSRVSEQITGDDAEKRRIQQEMRLTTSGAMSSLQAQESATRRNRDMAYAVKAGYIREYTENQGQDAAAPAASDSMKDPCKVAHQVLKREHARIVGRPYDNEWDDSDDDEVSEDGFVYDNTIPGAHDIPAPTITSANRRDDMRRYDSYLTTRDQYLATAVLVEEEADNGVQAREMVREKSERFRILEQRQEALEKQIQEQKQLIQTHQDELELLKGTHGEIVHAQVIAPDNDDINSQIRQRESIIAEQEAELNSLIDRSRSGLGLLRKEPRKKGGGFMSKFNPFRKNMDSIHEEDDHSRMGSTHKKSYLSNSEHSRTFSASAGGNPSLGRGSNSEHSRTFSANDRGNPSLGRGENISLSDHISSFSQPAVRQGSLGSGDLYADSIDGSEQSETINETMKRAECFIAPEKLPFGDRTIAELKKLAKDSKVDISGCFDREQIVNQLINAGVKPRKKNPLNKLFGGPKLTSPNTAPKATLKSPPSPLKSPARNRSKEAVDAPPVDMEVTNLSEKRASFFVPKQNDMFENFSISQLKKIARDRGVDVSTCSDRSDLVSVLYDAGLRLAGQRNDEKDPLESLSVQELKRLAASKNIDISSCVEKSQIVGALNVAGVQAPKNKKETLHDYSIAQLKRLAKKSNVDVSSCVEKRDIIAMLREAGVKPASGSVPRLTKGELSKWRPSQLRMLASHIEAPASGLGEGALLSGILTVVNEQRKSLRSPIRSIARFAAAPLPKLRSFAKQKKIDISGCVERDEILQRIIITCVP